jgi:hypothetical protein
LPTQGDLLFQQQAQPFGVVQPSALGIGRQIAEALDHPFKAKLVQTFEYWVVQQLLSPQWK